MELHCPICQSNEVETLGIDVDGNLTAGCPVCGAMFTYHSNQEYEPEEYNDED